jgi:hypothetical protein
LPEAEEGAEEEEETNGGAEEEGTEVAAPTETRYLACLSFFVRGVWGRLEKMERHVEERAGNVGDAAAEVDEAVAAFRGSLAAAERFRTAQAKGVLKAETLAAVDRAFFGVLERVRGVSTGDAAPALCSPYPENAEFCKGLIAVAADEERAAKAVDRARSLGADFVMLAVESGVDPGRPSDFPVIAGRVKGHFNRVLEFEAEGAVFRALVNPSGPTEALPLHTSGVRAMTGDVRHWHDCLALGHRLSYVSVDEGVGGTEGVPFVHVAAEKEAAAIVRAMLEGAFYVRTHPSPEIVGMEVAGRTLKVSRAEVSGICQLVLIGRDGPLALSPTGTAEYELKGSEQFVRVQILAGTTKVDEKQVDLTTILNPVYPAEWVAPWLDEIEEEEVVEDEEDLPPEG